MRNRACGIPAAKIAARLFARAAALLACALAASPAPAADGVRAVGESLELRAPGSLRHYGYEEGLPQASVNTILRTRDGFLWLGTFGGLVRFDGREFRTFRSADDGEGPASRRVLSLFEDERRRLWIGTEDAGINVYENGRFRHLPICGGTCTVNRMFSVDGRDLWVLTANEVFHLDADSLQATGYGTAYNGYAYHAQIGPRAFIGGVAGFARLSPGGVEIMPLPDGHEHVRMMAADSAVVWVVFEDGGLYRYDAANGRWTSIRNGLPPETHLMSDRSGGIYISDETSGVRHLARDGGESPIEGAARLHAGAAWVDDDGALWLGTTGKGLWRLRPSRLNLLRSTTGPDSPGRVVIADGAGGVWLVLGCARLWHLHADGSRAAWPLTAAIGEDCVHSLLRDDASGTLWLGTTGGLLARIVDGRTERVAAWPQSSQVGVWKAKDGRLWLANGHFVGRLRLSGEGGFDQVETIAELAGMDVKKIVDARAGGVWVVGDRGAFRVVSDTVVERWTSAQGIRGRYFRALHEDADGVLWIGTYGSGLVRIERGVVRQYNEANGLFDDTVSCILPNADGRLWMAGNRGISLLLDRNIGADGPDVLTLTGSDGLDPAEFNGGTAPPCADDGAGHLWFALMVGFARVDPAALRSWAASYTPPVYIDHAAVSQQSLDVHAPADLGVNASNLEIRYGAIDLLNPDKVRYRYRVDHGESDWIDAGSNRSVLLPVVPWGPLVFEVQARELGGAWSPSATLHLNRPRPWYKYHWIWLAASLASLLTLLWITRERRVSDRDDALLARLRRPEAESDR